MVINILIPFRHVFKVKHIIKRYHLESMAKLLVVTSMIVGYAYGVEFFIAWYAGNPFEQAIFAYRPTGDFAVPFWLMVCCNVLVPLLFLVKKVRTNLAGLFVVALLVNVGMWFERFVIIATSLSRDFLPSSWGYFKPTLVDVLMFLGSFGLFFTLFLLFCRYLPMVAMAEVKAVLPQAHGEGHH